MRRKAHKVVLITCEALITRQQPLITSKTYHLPQSGKHHCTARRIALRPGVLRRIRKRLRLIVGNVLYAEELEYLKERFAVMTERDRAVMRITLLNQNVTVEPSHLVNRKHADAAEEEEPKTEEQPAPPEQPAAAPHPS